MKRWLEGNFSQAAAFVARHIRHHKLQNFIFTGCSSQEGTTTTMLGIARELQATYGLRVLAIEINARRGGFKNNLRLAKPPLQFIGEMSVSSEDILYLDGGLGLLSIRGKEVERQAQSFSTDLLQRALKDLGNEFDVVLIDAQPVLEYTEVLSAAQWSLILDTSTPELETNRVQVEPGASYQLAELSTACLVLEEQVDE